MPIYEYFCKKCDKKFELRRPFSQSKDPAECPVCNTAAERVLSSCYSRTCDASGATSSVGGSSCSSCGGGSCSSCGH